MRNFTYYTPTKIYFGDDAEMHVGEDLKKRGATKVLIHYGSERIRKNGLFDRVACQLDEQGIAYVALGGVQPNPTIQFARQGIELCRREGVDFLLAIGGGSVLDSTKAIRLGLSLNIDPWEAITKGISPDNPVPMGSILTMAAAGSEMSNSCVLTDEERHLKRGCNFDGNRPTVAFMNPALTATTPAYQTAAGITDIMMHSMERYLTNEPATPLTDAVCLGILRTVKEQGALLMKDLTNVELRGEIMWASSISHNNLTELGRAKRTFTAHRIEHDISGVHDVTHGAGLAVVFPAWCLAEAPYGVERFYSLMHELWDAPEADTESEMLESVKAGVENMRAYYRSIGMPTHMSELGVDPSEYEYISGLTTNGGTLEAPSFRGKLTQQDIIDIYRLAE